MKLRLILILLLLGTTPLYAQKLNKNNASLDRDSSQEISTLPVETQNQPKPSESLSTDEIYNRYAQGKNAYLYGSYPQCIEILSSILIPNSLIVDIDQRIDAYRYLGLSLYYLKNLEQSQSVFEKLLFLKPDYELDPVETPQEAISFLDKIKKELQTQLIERQKILEEERKKEEEKKKKINAISTEYEFQINSRFVALLPFGIGQYQNDDDVMGTTFLASEFITSAISVFAFIQVESLRQSDGKFSPIQFEQAQVYQNMQLISAYSTLALMLTGSIHALLTFKEKKLLKLHKSDKPLDLNDPSIEKSKSF